MSRLIYWAIENTEDGSYQVEMEYDNPRLYMSEEEAHEGCAEDQRPFKVEIRLYPEPEEGFTE